VQIRHIKSHKRLTVADTLGVGTWYEEVCRKNTTVFIGKRVDAKKGQPKRRMLTRLWMPKNRKAAKPPKVRELYERR
jgi:hypothetical protein